VRTWTPRRPRLRTELTRSTTYGRSVGATPNGKDFKDLKDRVEEYLAINILLGMDLDMARNGTASDWTQCIHDWETFCAKQSCGTQDYRK
jgi:hypothetical protein